MIITQKVLIEIEFEEDEGDDFEMAFIQATEEKERTEPDYYYYFDSTPDIQVDWEYDGHYDHGSDKSTTVFIIRCPNQEEADKVLALAEAIEQGGEVE